jgi:anti-anti-sigma factor
MVTITIETDPSTQDLKIIAIQGSMDTVTLNEVDEKVLPIIDEGKSDIIFDLTNLNFLSSISMMKLIKYFIFLTNKKRLFMLIKPPEHIYESLKTAGVAKHLNMFDKREDAIRYQRISSKSGLESLIVKHPLMQAIADTEKSGKKQAKSTKNEQ